MKQLVYKLIRSVSKKWNVNIFSVIAEKWRALRSQWIAGKMAEVGKGCFFSSVAQLRAPQFIHIGSNTIFGRELYLTAWGG